MVGNLTHLHDQSEDVGVVVQQNTLGDIGLEFASAVVHNAACKVVLLFAEEFAIDINLLGWELHRGGVVCLDSTEHETVG